MTGPILIVDDDPVQCRLIENALTGSGYESIVVASGEAALEALDGPRAHDPAAVILDLMMPGIDGNGVLKEMRRRGITAPVIVQTAQTGIDTVVAAMRNGAFDFVVKPASPERLLAAVANALKVEALGSGEKLPGRQLTRALTFKDILTGSGAMDRVIRLAQKAAASSIPILIEGESGVGKELVARAIRGGGDRRSKPFVTVNCGAIPDNLVESILFGHEKGAFTGATERHVGKFVEADTGTLFLDEVGDLPPELQVKLLRAVQHGEVDPVGARSTVKVDFRLISATHRDLLQHVRDGRFREDLFYRLNVFPIFVPPLRDRREDIPLLVRHFMARVGPPEARHRITGISPHALRILGAYDWPGNVRQLENAVFRAMVLCEGDTLTAEEFPQIRAQIDGVASATWAPIVAPETEVVATGESRHFGILAGAARAGAEGKHFGLLRALDERGNIRSLAELEAEMIRLAIEHYQGQMSEVARWLGIGRSTLYRKLKEYGINHELDRAQRLSFEVNPQFPA
ncbi:MAG: sigma-54 dependent transcriptional regulator [Mesorhizobium sp.]